MDKNKVCRTCLSTELLNPIFPNLDDNERYSSALMLTSGLKITKNDGLTQLICSECVNFINLSLEFRFQCKHNELKLLKYSKENSEKYIYEGQESIKTIQDNSNKDSQIFTSVDANSDYITNQGKLIADPAELNKKETVENDISKEQICNQNNFILKTHILNDENYDVPEIDVKNDGSTDYPNDDENMSHCLTEITQNIPVESLNTKETNKIKIVDIKIINPNFKVKKIQEKTSNIPKSEPITDDNHNPSPNEEIQPNTNVIINSHFDLTENNKNKLTCKLCSEVISKKNKIGHLGNRHKDLEIGYEKCDICKVFIKTNDFKKHKMISHGSGNQNIVKNKMLTLSRESQTFYREGENRLSTSQNKILLKTKCEICNKDMLKNSLKQHILVQHSGMAPVCEHCGRTFGNKYRLQEHYRAKHGYEKYKCGYCSFESAAATSLKNHERLHTDDKPFVCHTCGVRFHAAYLLRQHKFLHTSEYNFKCNQCPAKFKSGNNLRNHLSCCHSSEKISCSICDKKFSSKLYAQRHLRRTHKLNIKIS